MIAEQWLRDESSDVRVYTKNTHNVRVFLMNLFCHR